MLYGSNTEEQLGMELVQLAQKALEEWQQGNPYVRHLTLYDMDFPETEDGELFPIDENSFSFPMWPKPIEWEKHEDLLREIDRLHQENNVLRVENFWLQVDTKPYDWNDDSMPLGFSEN